MEGVREEKRKVKRRWWDKEYRNNKKRVRKTLRRWKRGKEEKKDTKK